VVETPSSVAPATPRLIKEVKRNAKPADDKHTSPQDFICASIIERSQVGEPISDAERIRL
jgi:hypothetical protein